MEYLSEDKCVSLQKEKNKNSIESKLLDFENFFIFFFLLLVSRTNDRVKLKRTSCASVYRPVFQFFQFSRFIDPVSRARAGKARRWRRVEKSDNGIKKFSNEPHRFISDSTKSFNAVFRKIDAVDPAGRPFNIETDFHPSFFNISFRKIFHKNR